MFYIYIMYYLGWAKYPDNSLEIISGTTSRGDLLGRYSASNMTIGQWFSPGSNLYIRLRGALSTDDRLNFIYTAVDNVTEGILFMNQSYTPLKSPENQSNDTCTCIWNYTKTGRIRF
jgi:hypothetical protein